MSGTDDAIREIHGMKCHTTTDKHATVMIREGERSVVFEGTIYSGTAMTPWQARYLASKLYRISRRLRNRLDVESTPVLTDQVADSFEGGEQP